MCVFLTAGLLLKGAAGTLLFVGAWSLTLALMAVAAGCLTVQRMMSFITSIGNSTRGRADRSRAHPEPRHKAGE